MKKMKNLLLIPSMFAFFAITACSTIGQLGSSGSGGKFQDSAQLNRNPAPANMSPPDFSTPLSSESTLDDSFLRSKADYHFTMGEALSLEGQSAKALEEFKSTLIYDPKSHEVRMRLASEYVRMGMITEAVEQAEAAVELAPDTIEPRMLLGGLYSGLKMFDQAQTQFSKVLEIEPGHNEASIYSGALMAEQQKYDESISYFEDLAKNKKFQEPEKAHYYIGRVHAEQGKDHYSAAEKAFGKALSVKPEYPEAALSLGLLLRAQAKDSEMEVLLKSYQEKFGPTHEMARQLAHFYLENEKYTKALEQLEVVDSFERDNINVKIQIALILIEQKKYELAAVRLEDILMSAPESDKIRYYLGAVYQELQKPTLSLQHYKNIPSTSTYFVEAKIHSAFMLKNMGQLDQAEDLIEKSIKERDDAPQLFAYYATQLDEKKKYKKALTMLKIAVDKFPSNTQLRFFLGTMQDRLGNPNETITQMTKVIEIDPDHVQALNYLAYTMAETGRDLNEAAALAWRALELQPDDGYILDTIGWIHFKKGENEEAIKYLEAAHKSKNDEAIIAEHLADAYLRFQMWQKAQAMYKRAAELELDQVQNKKIMEKLANMKVQNQKATRRPASTP